MVNTQRAPVKKTAYAINFKLYPHISNRLLNKTALVRPNNESFIFYCNSSTSFESVFCIKTVKCRLFKKHLKRRKSRACFCLSLAWLHISEQKLLKAPIIFVQEELISQEKQLVFGPTLTLFLLIFGERKNGKLYILKQVGLSKFKEIL